MSGSVMLLSGFLAASIGQTLAIPQPAKIRLQAAGAQKVGDARGFSLAVEVSNPNQKGPPLTFIGYKPDSFDPPIPKGQISPIHKVELKRAGKWQQQPMGWCGTGMGAIALTPRATATFGVWVPEGDWEAVRVGVTWTTVAFEKAGENPGDFTTVWSNGLTHKEVQQVKGARGDTRDIARVTIEQKKEFLELMKKLPSRGEFYTDEGVQLASPFLHVLLALSKKDITEDYYFALLALSRGLHDAKKEHREFAVKTFDKIPHPVIKFSWALMLFHSREVTPEVTRYLRESLDDRERAEMIQTILGPEFDAVRKEIIDKAAKHK